MNTNRKLAVHTTARVLAGGILAFTLLVAPAFSADNGYDWGMSVTPTPTQQTADVIQAGIVYDYGHTGPNWVYVMPWLHIHDPNWAGPSCSTTRYHNGIEEISQHMGAGVPSPFAWSLQMTPTPVTWRITVSCPVPAGSAEPSTVDATFSSELPPNPLSVVVTKPSINPVPSQTPKPTVIRKLSTIPISTGTRGPVVSSSALVTAPASTPFAPPLSSLSSSSALASASPTAATPRAAAIPKPVAVRVSARAPTRRSFSFKPILVGSVILGWIFAVIYYLAFVRKKTVAN